MAAAFALAKTPADLQAVRIELIRFVRILENCLRILDGQPRAPLLGIRLSI